MKLTYSKVFLFVGIGMISFTSRVWAQDAGVEIRVDRKIPMRDGVQLSAIIWKPANQQEPLPVVLVKTPYIADGDHHLALKFVDNGYVYVSVDRRGRGNSEGEFNPLEDSGLDGYDVIAWLAKQPWSNGQIAMRGGSYRGMVQWKIMAEHPQQLGPVNTI